MRIDPSLGLACSRWNSQFDFVVDPPDVSRIPASDVLGVTVIMVQAWYKNKEFLRVGYYVTVQYADEKLRVSTPVGAEGALLVRPWAHWARANGKTTVMGAPSINTVRYETCALRRRSLSFRTGRARTSSFWSVLSSPTSPVLPGLCSGLLSSDDGRF